MWELFLGIFLLWIFSKFILNVLEIVTRCEEMLAHRKFLEDLHQDLLGKITNPNNEEE